MQGRGQEGSGQNTSEEPEERGLLTTSVDLFCMRQHFGISIHNDVTFKWIFT